MDDFMIIKDMYIHPLLILDDDESKLKSEIILKRKRIKLLTYNIFLRPPPVKNNESDWKNERLIDFLQEIENYDIICLQEAFESFNTRINELVRIANKAGFFFFCSSPIPSFFSKYSVDGGLLILSRFPILSHEFVPFDYGVLSDALAYKGYLMAHLKIAESNIVIINTHTQASYFQSSEEHWKVSSETRLYQIKSIGDYLTKIYTQDTIHKISRNTLCYLCGDLNVEANNFSLSNSIPEEFRISDEYKCLIDIFKNIGEVKDIFYNYHKIHPITYGDKNLEKYEDVLTYKLDVGSNMSLDYILEIKPNYITTSNKFYINSNKETVSEDINLKYFNNLKENKISVDTYKDSSIFDVKLNDKINNSNIIMIKNNKLSNKKIDNYEYEYNNTFKNSIKTVDSSAKVEPFFVDRKPYTQLSDHYGLSVEIEYI